MKIMTKIFFKELLIVISWWILTKMLLKVKFNRGVFDIGNLGPKFARNKFTGVSLTKVGVGADVEQPACCTGLTAVFHI